MTIIGDLVQYESMSCTKNHYNKDGLSPQVVADEDDAGRAEQDCDSEPFFTAKFKLALLCSYLSKTSINTHFHWTGRVSA